MKLLLLCSAMNLFRSRFLLLLVSASTAMPPPDPIHCDSKSGGACTLRNSYGAWPDRRECEVSRVIRPATEQELLSAVGGAVRRNLSVKAVSGFSHTIPKLACPSRAAVLISTSGYDSEISVDAAKLAVTAGAGAGLRRVIDAVEASGLSLAAAPYWEGVSVGGMVSTGAHGSSWWGRGGAVHDHVIGMTLVVPAKPSQGYAKVVDLGPNHPLLNAAKLSLGNLGVISKVTLALEPAFKRSITYNFTGDDGIEDIFMEHANKYEFADITWYPSAQTAVYRYDNRVPLNSSGNAVYDFLGFQSNSVLISKSLRATETAFDKARNSNGKCLLAKTSLGYKKLIANGLRNGLIFTGYPAIGHQGKMQTSGSCLYSPSTRPDSTCAWDPRINGLFFYESTAIFSANTFRSFLLDVKKLRDLVRPESFCGVDIYNGLLIRFIKASDAYLGQPEDSVVVDFNYYRADDALTPRLHEDVWEEIEQMAFFKYRARPHWAKNRNLAFHGVQGKYPNFGKYVEAKKRLDPGNVFSSDWTDEILFGREGERGDGCALEGQCICSEDRHCSPAKGYLCQAGLVYKEARVCRYSQPSSSSSEVVVVA